MMKKKKKCMRTTVCRQFLLHTFTMLLLARHIFALLDARALIDYVLGRLMNIVSRIGFAAFSQKIFKSSDQRLSI